jgi:Fe-Mn family superoxide dismutase
LPPLPYDYNALEPHLGEQTLRIHHDKHHAKYVSTCQTLIAGTDLEKADLVTIMRKAHGTNPSLFNNAAQSWNHTFYWHCMKANGGGKPSGKLA